MELKKPKIRPLFERLIVEPKEVDKTKGGLFLPDDVNIEPITAVVLAKGTGVISSGQVIDFPIQVGDTIIILKDSLAVIEFNGEKVYSCRMTDVMGIVEP